MILYPHSAPLKKTLHSSCGLLIKCCFLFCILVGTPSAGVKTWTGGGGDNNWTTAANWGGTAPVSGDDLVFGGSTRLAPNNDISSGNFSSITFSGASGNFVVGGNSINISGGGIAITNNASGGSMTLNLAITFTTSSPTVTCTSGGGLNFSGSISMGSLPLTITGGGGIVISGVLSGTGSLTKTGGGELTLSGANTYSGPTSINSGAIKLGHISALGSTGTGTTVTGGAALNLNGINYSSQEPLTLNGLGISGGGALVNTNASNATFAGLITLGSTSSIVAANGGIVISNTGSITGSSFDLTLGGSYPGEITSAIATGTGALLKLDGGAWKLSGANSYSGVTTDSAGTLILNNATALGTAGGNTVVIAGSAIDLNGVNYSMSEPITINGNGIAGAGALVNTNGSSATFPGLLTLGSATSIVGQSGSINLTNSGAIAGSYSLTLGGTQGGALASTLTGGILVKQDAGTWIISGSNSLTLSSLSLSAGTLNLGAALTHSVSTTLSLTGGTLEFSSSTLQFAGSSIDFSALGTLTSGTGTLEFTGASAQAFLPKSTGTHPNILVTGAGTVNVGGNFTSGSFTQYAGTWNWGTGLSATVSSINTSGGTATMNFGTSTVHVNSGNVNLSGLSSIGGSTTGTLGFDAGSGTQVFVPKSSVNHPAIIHAGAGTLQLASYALSCQSFSQTAGSLDLNSQNLSITGGNFSITNGNSSSITGLAARTITVSGTADFTATSAASKLNLNPGSAWTLAVTGTLTASLATLGNNTASVSAGSCSNCANTGSNTNWNFSSVWDGGGADNNWTTVGNWVSDVVPSSLDNVTFNATSTKSCTLDAAVAVKSLTMVTAYTGTLTLGSNTLTSTGNVDLRSGGTVSAASGTIAFTGSSPQNFYNRNTTYGTLVQNGSGGTSMQGTVGLTVTNLTLTSGTFGLLASYAHNITNINGSGGLNFNGCTIFGYGNIDFSAITLSGTSGATLSLCASGAQSFNPNVSETSLQLTKGNGSGTCTVLGNFTTPYLTVALGTLILGVGLTHNVTGYLNVSGGTLEFGTSTLKVQASTVNLNSLAGLTPGTGTLEFNGTGTQTFTPKASTTHPAIVKSASGTVNIATNGLTAGTFSQTGGTWNWGSAGLVHNVASLATSGSGTMDFGTSTVRISSGNAGFTGLGTLGNTSGTLEFTAVSGTQVLTPKSGATHPTILHSGAGTLQLGTNALTAKNFQNTAGALDFNGMDLTVASGGTLIISNGTASTLVNLGGRVLTIGGNTTLSGTAGTSRLNLDPASAWTLAVTGTLTANYTNLKYSNASGSAGICTNCFSSGSNTSWTFSTVWDGGGADNNWTTPANWGSDTIPSTNEDVVFNGTSVKNVTLDVNVTVNSLTMNSAYTGTFNFGASTLSIATTADFRSGGALTASTGTLSFTGSTAQTFIPKSGATFPDIVKSGAGTTTVTTNALSAGTLSILAGGFNLGTGFTHTFGAISGSSVGTLDFGTSNLNITTNVNLASATVTASTSNTINFIGTVAQSYTPNASVTALNITQNGSGGTSIYTNGFTTPTLTIISGNMNLGSGLTHAVTSALSISGGGLDFGSSTLQVQSSAVDFTSLSTLTPGTGTLVFTGSAAQTFTPKAGVTHPNIGQYGTGGTSVATNNLTAGTLTLNQGTFNLGTSRSHTFTSVSDGGGGPYGSINFSNSQLHVTGNVLLGNVTTLTPGTGTLAFDGTSGAQLFVPKSGGASHPFITHGSADTLRLATNNLSCLGFTQTAGVLDLNSKNITTTSGGNFSVTNGTSNSIAGLAGVTITVAGAGTFTGTSAANRLNLNPGSAWVLTVTTSLSGNFVTLANNTASGSAGACTNCANGGSNTNWTFATGWVGGGGNDHNWTTGANWGSGTAPTGAEDVTFDATSISNATLDAANSVKSITVSSGYTGTLSFSNNTLTVTGGNADFRGGETISAGTGSLAFTSASAQTFYPKSGQTFPNLIQNGAGGTTLAVNPLTCGDLTISSGTLNLGTGMTHTVKNISGNGGLDFNTSNLVAMDTLVNLSALSLTASASNTLRFSGSNVSFTPKSSMTTLNLTVNGSGTVTSAGAFSTPTLNVSSGRLNLVAGTSLVSSTLTISGGILDFGSAHLQVPATTVNFNSLSSLIPGSGVLEFIGTSPQTFTPKSGTGNPAILLNGSGGVTLATNLNTLGIDIQAGTLNLGTGHTHIVTGGGNIVTSGGGLNFSSSILEAEGNVNLSGLATTTPGSGTLRFTSNGSISFTPKAATTYPNIEHTGTSNITLATNPLTCASFNQTAGSFNLAGLALTTVSAGDLTVTNGTSTSLTGLGSTSVTVAGNASFTGTSAANHLNLNPGTSWTLAVVGTLTGNFLTLANNTASSHYGICSNCTNSLANTNWTFATGWVGGGGADHNWTTAANWGSGSVPTNADNVTFDATSVSDANLNAAESVKSLVIMPGYTGTISFGTNTLTIANGDADFRGGETLAPGTGSLAFTSASSQIFYPKAGQIFPSIVQNGAGGTTVSTNALTAGDITVTTGTLTLAGTLTHSVGAISGAGAITMGTSSLSVSGSVDLSTLSGFSGATGSLTFNGASAQTFKPFNYSFQTLTQNGSGGTILVGAGFTVGTLNIVSGSFGIGSQSVQVSQLSASGGTLDMGSGTIAVSGICSLGSLGSIVPGTGTIELNGGSPQTFIPKNGATHPNIYQNGAGGTTITANGLNAGSLTISTGTFDLGSGFTHAVTSIATSGGGLTFNNSNLQITSGNAVFSGLSTLTPGTGRLTFTGAAGTQSVEAKASATHPHITHSGAGSLRLMNASITCLSFTQSAGSLNFNNYNLTTISTGDFTVTNGDSTSIAGLVGRTLTVAGNASFTGAVSSNRLNLNPTASWTLNVAGSATVSLASVAYGNAAGGSIVACSNCANLGSNTNWTFAVTWNGGGGDANWTTPENWSSNYVPSSTDAVSFNATALPVTLNANVSVKSITLTTGYTGAFSFSTNTLTINTGNADFRSGGSITAGTGILEFTSPSNQIFRLNPGSVFPTINQNNASGTTNLGDALLATNLIISAGTFSLNPGDTHTFGGLSGNGTLDFNNANINITGNADLSGLTLSTVPSTSLSFTGTSAQTYKPKSSPFSIILKQNGTGGTTILSNNFSTTSLYIISGTLHLGAGLVHTVNSNLIITGGSLDFASSTLKVKGSTVDLTSLMSLSFTTGTLEFNNSVANTFTPKASMLLPNLIQSGTGTTTVTTNSFQADGLSITGGKFNLGAALTHQITSLSASAGELDFGSSNLQVSGDANLSGLTTLTPSTGTLTLNKSSGIQTLTPKNATTHPSISHNSTGTMQLAINSLICGAFAQTSGILDFNGQEITTVSGGNFSVTNGTPTTIVGLGGRTLTIAGATSLTGTTGNLLNLDPGTIWNLTVTGPMSANLTRLGNCNASIPGLASSSIDAGGNTNWDFTVTWDGGAGDHNWTSALNWSTDSAPSATTSVVFDGTSVSDLYLDSDASVKSISLGSLYLGLFDFKTHNLSVAGNADFRSGGSINPSTGSLTLIGATAKTFYAKAGGVFPNLIQNGTGSTTVSGSIRAGSFTSTLGSLILGAGTTDTLTSISGTGGTLDFSTANLKVSGNVNFSGLSSVIPGSGQLTFIGSSAQSFTPKSSGTIPALVQEGSGGTIILVNAINTPSLSVKAGTLKLGSSLNHVVTSTFYVTGGGLDFGTSTLSLASPTADFTSMATLTAGTGTLTFNSGSAQTFIPKTGFTFPDILQSGAGGTTLSGASLRANSLTIQAGAFHLGTALAHIFKSIVTTGGLLDFGSSSAEVTTGDADFSGLATLTTSGGQLNFSAASGIQNLLPKFGGPHPLIVHSGVGTLKLGVTNLICDAFRQQAGIFDFNGKNLTVSGTGALEFLNGGSGSLLNLASRIITVGGTATFRGLPGNHINLNPSIAWNLSVTGQLKAFHADIKNNLAALSAGLADSSINQMGNTNWTFLDTIKPDNVTALVATAIGANSAQISWTASSSTDADSVMLRYRTDGTYPVNQTDGMFLHTVAASKTVDTAYGISDKTIYQFAAFIRDSASNWSPAIATAQDSAFIPDITPPTNITNFVANALSSTKVSLAWTPSVSTDADTSVIRYRTDGIYPTGPFDGLLWKKRVASSNKDTVTGLVENTIYYFGVYVRDGYGNYSSVASAARDTSLYQAPVSGSIVINDVSGFTKNINPTLTFTYAKADSMRFALLADTSASTWKTLHSTDSLNMALGVDGKRIAAVQYKNIFGKRSIWFRDTTTLDRIAPVITTTLKANHSYKDWPGGVIGSALDATVGTDSVFVTRVRELDGNYFNGSGWTTVADTARLRTDSSFNMLMPSGALDSGFYVFNIYAKDKLGNSSTVMTRRVRYEANRTPSLFSSTIPDTMLQNQILSMKVDIGDLDIADSVVTVSTSYPPWLTLTEKPDTASGAFAAHRIYTLTGTPTQPQVGGYTITIQARDLGGKIFIYSKPFVVKDVNDSPVFAAAQSTLSVQEDSVTLWLPKYTDPDPTDKHTFNLLTAPAFIKVEDSALVFRAGSRDVGTFPISLTVSDGTLLDTLDVMLTVVNVNDAPVAFPFANWKSPAVWKEDLIDTFTVLVVDMDKGDPIKLSTTLPAFITYQTFVDSVNSYNRFFKFKMSPHQADTGQYSFKLHFIDSAGASSDLALSAHVRSINDTPFAIIKGNQIFAGAARFSFDVADEDGNLATTRFHYRLIGPTGDTLRRGITSLANLSLHPLADGKYNLAILAEDEGGLKQSRFTQSAFTIIGATTISLDSARWNMVAVANTGLPVTTLGIGAILTTWDETSEDGQALSRYAAGKTADSLKRGKGYWVRVAKHVTLAAAQNELLDRPFKVKLTHAKQGWNQIGNPFPYYVDLSATKLQFWEWDADKRDLVNAKGLLKPLGAYWVQVAKDTSLIVLDTPYFPAQPGVLGKLASFSPGYRQGRDWSMQLALQAGPYQDMTNYLGVRSPQSNLAQSAGSLEATQSMSSLNAYTADAPKFGDYIALHFDKPGITEDSLSQGLATDFRDHLDNNEEWWDFTLENSGSGFEKANLTLPGVDKVLAAGLHVFIVRKGEVLPVSTQEPTTLAMEGNTTHYSLVVSPHSDFAERLKGNFNISQNFPNPVQSLTTFRFFLPQTWGSDGKRESKLYHLRLNVYDFSGRLAAQVTEGSFKPGSHSLLWHPESKSGGMLSKGAYVYRLEVSGFTKSLKLLVK